MNRIALFVSSNPHFFQLGYCLNCAVSEYVGCDNVIELFNFEDAARSDLVDLYFGIKISRPLKVDRDLKGGYGIFAALSHLGVLAIFEESSRTIQIVDLPKDLKVEIKTEATTHTGFYDDKMVMLVQGDTIKISFVKQLFEKPTLASFSSVGSELVECHTDVSVLQSTRLLLFSSRNSLHDFDVDTERVRTIDINESPWSVASLTGINVGVRAVFKANRPDYHLYSLGEDNVTSLVSECIIGGNFDILIPSSSDPTNLEKAMEVYSNGLFCLGPREIGSINTPVKYQYFQSIVRLYQDFFLIYDGNSRSWCVVRIVVP